MAKFGCYPLALTCRVEGGIRVAGHEGVAENVEHAGDELGHARGVRVALPRRQHRLQQPQGQDLSGQARRTRRRRVVAQHAEEQLDPARGAESLTQRAARGDTLDETKRRPGVVLIQADQNAARHFVCKIQPD